MGAGATGSNWAIAAPHSAATEAGAAAFEGGGNAVDAALVAAVALAVTYPHMCGIGGDLFALVQRPDGSAVAINASGRAPEGLDPESVRALTGSDVMPEHGPFTVTVPGAVSGWAEVHRQGASLPWAAAFDPALAYAVEGVAVAPDLALTIAEEPQFAQDPGLSALFVPDGTPLSIGAPLVQPELAETLRAIAAEGPSALYEGQIGRRMVAGLAAAGVPIASADLSSHRPVIGPPLRGRYRDFDVSVVPPNSQGVALLQMLALLERLGLEPDPLGPDAGRLARLFRTVALDRDRHLADGDRMTAHVSTLLDDGHLAGLGQEIVAPLGTTQPRPGGDGDTIALMTADASGFAVSLIQSLYGGLGSGILEPSTGILAQSRGACFTLERGHPNELRGGARSAHTLMPVLVHREGVIAAVAGTAGGYAQPQINAMTLIRALDLGMGAEGAVSSPRWLVGGMDPSGGPPTIVVDNVVGSSVRERLSSAGFAVEDVGPDPGSVGHAQLILADDQGLHAGSDPRADGGSAAG